MAASGWALGTLRSSIFLIIVVLGAVSPFVTILIFSSRDYKSDGKIKR